MGVVKEKRDLSTAGTLSRDSLEPKGYGACHEGRGRSPSVSEMGEKTDFLTFQLNCKNIQQINQQCKQTNYCQGGVLSKTEDLAETVE